MKDIQRKKMFFFLMLLNIAVFLGFQSWSTLFNNFAFEEAGFNGFYMGLAQSIREIPGFLSLLVILAIIMLKEHTLAAASVVLLGLGIGMTGFFPSTTGVIITTLVMSFGFHFYETVNQSLTLQYFNKMEAPLVLGRLRSISAGANIAAGGLVMLLLTFMSYKYIFLTVGILVAAAGLYCLRLDPADADLPPQKKKLELKKRYWLYYALTFFAGARRQVFIAFSVFLMVEKFKYSTNEIAILFIINNVVNFLFNPYIGKFINRYGERKVLSVEYLSLIFVFLGYAFIDNKLFVAFLYIFDHIVFNFAVAIRTFYQKISAPEDMANGSAVGFTINHIAAVFIPFAGGLLWVVDRKIPFITGAVLALCSLVLTQFITSELKKSEKTL